MTRREFLIGSSLLTAGGCRLWREEVANLVLGVVSDIHVSAKGGDLGWSGDAAFFEKTLRWYRERDVDAIVIPGDLANFGLVDATGARLARILSPDYFKGPASQRKTVECRIRRTPAAPFQITPVGWTGQRGVSLTRSPDRVAERI